MSKYEQFVVPRLDDYSLDSRPSKVSQDDFARPLQERSIAGLIRSFPRILAARDLLDLADRLLEARRRKRARIWGFGGHVIKVGLAPILIDLMERGFVTALATHVPPTMVRHIPIHIPSNMRYARQIEQCGGQESDRRRAQGTSDRREPDQNQPIARTHRHALRRPLDGNGKLLGFNRVHIPDFEAIEPVQAAQPAGRAPAEPAPPVVVAHVPAHAGSYALPRLYWPVRAPGETDAPLASNSDDASRGWCARRRFRRRVSVQGHGACP